MADLWSFGVWSFDRWIPEDQMMDEHPGVPGKVGRCGIMRCL